MSAEPVETFGRKFRRLVLVERHRVECAYSRPKVWARWDEWQWASEQETCDCGKVAAIKAMLVELMLGPAAEQPR